MKKFVALTGAVVISLTMSMPAYASSTKGHSIGCGYTTHYSIMYDKNGNFLDLETFEANLEEAIGYGFVEASDRDYFLNRYDWCVNRHNSVTRGHSKGRHKSRH